MDNTLHISNRTRYLFFFLISFLILYFFIIYKYGYIFALAFIFFFPVFLLLCYLIIKNPCYGVVLMIIGTSLDIIGRLPDLPVTIFHIGVFLTAFSVILKKIYFREPFVYTTNFNLPLFLFLITILFSLFYTPLRLEGFICFLRILVLMFVLFLTINAVEKKSDIYIILSSLLICAIILSIFSIKIILGSSTSLIEIAANFNKVIIRSAASFDNPNRLATFLMIGFSIGFSFILNSKFKFIKIIPLIIITIIITFAIGSTFSRSVWVSLIPLSLIIIYYSKYNKIILVSLFIASVLIIILFYNNPFFQSVLIRIKSITHLSKEASNTTRIHLAIGGIKMFMDSNFIGVGFKGFSYYYSNFYIPASQLLRDVVDSHALPIEILAELGIFGFSLSIYIVYKYFKFAISSIKRLNNSPVLRACQISIFASLTGFFIDHLFSPAGLTHNWLWIGFGLTYAIDTLIEKNENETV